LWSRDPIRRRVLRHGPSRPASGEARLDTLVKTKTPALVTQNFTVTEQDILATTKLYPLTQQSMKSDRFMPNRLSLTCSRRNYSYSESPRYALPG